MLPKDFAYFIIVEKISNQFSNDSIFNGHFSEYSVITPVLLHRLHMTVFTLTVSTSTMLSHFLPYLSQPPQSSK